MTTFYKATRPDGRDFRTRTVDYAAALTSGDVVKHPRPMLVRQRMGGNAGDYLSVSTSPTDCTGTSWPCRLFVVEPVGRVWTPNAADLPNKRACHSLRVVEERPAYEALGPQGVYVAALVERAARLTAGEARRLAAAWAAARDAAWAAARDAARAAAWAAARAAAWAAARDAARAAAWAAARDAAWAAAWAAARDAAWAAARAAAWAAAGDAAGDAAWAAARDAATGLVVRDLITTEYDALTLPWRQTVGRIHPDDAEVSA